MFIGILIIVKEIAIAQEKLWRKSLADSPAIEEDA